MVQSTRRIVISNTQAEKLLRRLPLVGVEIGTREFEADLFRLIDLRNLRMSQIGVPEADIEAQPWEYNDWVVENAVCCFEDRCDVHCGDCLALCTATVDITRLKNFTTDIEHALWFERQVVRRSGFIRISERDKELLVMFDAEIIDHNDRVLGQYMDVDLAPALVGAVLTGLTTGFLS